MTLIGALVGMLGMRNSIRYGCHCVLLPRKKIIRTPIAAFLSIPKWQLWLVSTNHPSSSNCYDHHYIYRRSFWTWRGGDDKKWTHRDADEDEDGGDDPESSIHHDDDDEDDDLVDEATIQAARETSTNNMQPQLNPSAYQVSVCTAQGFRSYMEDEFFLSMDGDFAAVFDGHGGQAVSRYLRQNLYANLQALLPSYNNPLHNNKTTTTIMGGTAPWLTLPLECA